MSTFEIFQNTKLVFCERIDIIIRIGVGNSLICAIKESRLGYQECLGNQISTSLTNSLKYFVVWKKHLHVMS